MNIVLRQAGMPPRYGMLWGLLAAVATHAGAYAVTLIPLVHDCLAAAEPATPSKPIVEVDVESEEPPPPAPPVAAPALPALPEARAIEPIPSRPTTFRERAEDPGAARDEEPPREPSEASQVITAGGDAPVDLTGDEWSIVDGHGVGPVGGVQSAHGTAEAPSKGRIAAGAGDGTKANGAGLGPNDSPRGTDRASPAAIEGGRSWSCQFPVEADAAQIDRAAVVIVVTVRVDGTAATVTVLNDPGNGFGGAARRCAREKRYRPARDRAGNAIQASTPPIHVLFKR